MLRINISIFVISIIFLLSGCFGFKEVGKSENCPPSGTEVQFEKVMNPAFAEDYVGCDIITKAQFYASGQGNYVLTTTSDDYVVNRFLPINSSGEKNAFSGETNSYFVAVPKDQSNLFFELKQGDLLELRGGTHVSSSSLASGIKEVVFFVTSAKLVKGK